MYETQKITGDSLSKSCLF